MKKFLPYILILVVMFGLFGMAGKVGAAGPSCTNDIYKTEADCTSHKDSNGNPFKWTTSGCWSEGTIRDNINQANCKQAADPGLGWKGGIWQKVGDPVPPAPYGPSSSGTTDEKGSCVYSFLNGSVGTETATVTNTLTECRALAGKALGGTWTPSSGGTTVTIPGDPNQTKIANNVDPKGTKTPFENSLDESCGTFPIWSVPGCLLKLVYYTYFQIPSFLLWISALFFNALISLVIQSDMYTKPFITDAWGVVRDFSNIFFILVLLYAAFETILGMSHDVKKTLANVIIVALLINFSMFFTKVVIDSSNILALVFYNKLDTTYTNSKGEKVERPNTTSTPYNEKDLSGAIYQKFNATELLTGPFLDKLRGVTPAGVPSTTDKGNLPFALTLGIIVVSGSIMIWAAFVLFTAGIFFLGRLIELWVLIIFSPFAFVSFTIPLLKSTPFIGWDEWLKKLLSTSFMAPIFMFFMYLIFKLLEKNIFSDFTTGDGAIVKILSILIPAMIIMALLKQATAFAKKGGGMFGEMAMTGAKILGGLTVGLATGGTAALARAGIAGVAAKASQTNYRNVETLHKQDLANWEAPGGGKSRGAPKPKFIDTMTKYQASAPYLSKDWLGGKINIAQLKSGEVDHARHEMEEIKKKAGVEGIPDKRLSGVELKKVENTFLREKRSEIETSIKKGQDSSGGEIEIDANGIKAIGENDYKAQRREEIVNDIKRADPSNVEADGSLSKLGKEKLDKRLAELSTEFDEVLKELAAKIGAEKFATFQHEAMQPVSMGTRVAASSTTGSYDIRRITNLWEIDKNASKGAKIGFGALTMALAPLVLGMRTGLKQGVGDLGKVQGNFLKDMGQTITSALKNFKIDVALGGGGESHAPNKAHAPDSGHH